MPTENRRRHGRGARGAQPFDISEDVKRLVPVLGKETALRLERAFLLGDETMRGRILEMMDALRAAVFSDSDLKESVLIEPPSQKTAAVGNIEIGTVLYGKKRLYPLMLDKELLLTHIGIFGSSGYGKTNIVFWLAQKLADLDVPVIIFDFSKRNYRELMQIPQLKEKVDVFTVGREASPFRFNPLRPPEGVTVSQWAKEFAEIFDHAYWLMGGGKHIILKALEQLYKTAPGETTVVPNQSAMAGARVGVQRFAGARAASSAGYWPRIKDINEWLTGYGLSQKSSRERNWVSTAERPIASLCFMDTGRIFDADEGTMPSTFFKRGRITVLELDALSTNDRTFFIEITLQWIRDWLVASNFREKLGAVIVLEEAHNVLNREKSRREGTETVMDIIFREIRELGMGVVYVDQHPSLVSYPALGNTSTHIYMNLGLDTQHSSDIRDAGAMLGLDYDEEGDYLRRLPVGHAFMLCRRLEFSRPFLVEFPLVPIKKGAVTDEMVEKAMKGKFGAAEPEIIADGEIGSSRISRVGSTRMAARIEAAGTEGDVNIDPRDAEDERLNRAAMDQAAMKIIQVLGNGDASSTSEIYNAIGMSGSAFKTKAKKLLELGLIGAREARVYKQNAVFYFLTEKGRALFERKFGSAAATRGGRPQSPNAISIPEIVALTSKNLNLVFDPIRSGFIIRGAEDGSNTKAGAGTVGAAGTGAAGTTGAADGTLGAFARLVTTTEKDKLLDTLNIAVGGLEIGGSAYFVAASERIKNFLIQEAAVLPRTEGIRIFVATAQNPDFKKIEFAK